MEIKPELETFAKIKVVGVGGAGCSVVNRMVKSKIQGVEFVAVNTDAQALHHSDADVKVHIGKNVTRGLGAGMDPEIGRAAAEESKEDLVEALKGADMIFIAYGLGGGTGTGAAPIVADVAREVGALTIAVLTKPFSFEGAQRAEVARVGMEAIQDRVDTLIITPNDRLFQIIDKKTPLLDAFATVDQVLSQGVQGISDLITVPGIVNVDFADVKSVMQNAGSALMGIGTATGEDRAVEAAKQAIDSPLLEMSINGARGILFTITGGSDLGMYEIDEAAKVITESADPNARVIFGAVVDEKMQGEVRISVVATGFDREKREPERRGIDTSGIMVTPGVRREEKKPFFSAKAADFLSGSRRTQEAVPVQAEQPQPAATEPAPMARPQMRIEEESMVDESVPKADDDQLDIPAFIRKKMK
jgi:cell division protein FtsZ